MNTLSVPTEILVKSDFNQPALLKVGRTYSLIEKEELDAMADRFEIRKLPSHHVTLRWEKNGVTEKRTLRTAELKWMSGLRGFSARMSPRTPGRGGRHEDDEYYLRLIEFASLDGAKSSRIRELFEGMKGNRHNQWHARGSVK